MAQIQSSSINIEPVPEKTTLVIIRPYNYYYFGHSVEVLVNGASQVKLPNQSYSTLIMPSGKLDVIGQSGLLGPQKKEIYLEGQAGEVIYLLWRTTEKPSYTSVVPVVLLNWDVLSKSEADIYLKSVEFVGSKDKP